MTSIYNYFLANIDPEQLLGDKITKPKEQIENHDFL